METYSLTEGDFPHAGTSIAQDRDCGNRRSLAYGTAHGLRNEMYIGSRSGSGTCFVAFRGCAERRNFSHIESRGNNVSEIAHEAVSCYIVCLLSSRCATRGLDKACLCWLLGHAFR